MYRFPYSVVLPFEANYESEILDRLDVLKQAGIEMLDVLAEAIKIAAACVEEVQPHEMCSHIDYTMVENHLDEIAASIHVPTDLDSPETQLWWSSIHSLLNSRQAGKTMSEDLQRAEIYSNFSTAVYECYNYLVAVFYQKFYMPVHSFMSYQVTQLPPADGGYRCNDVVVRNIKSQSDGVYVQLEMMVDQVPITHSPLGAVSSI